MSLCLVLPTSLPLAFENFTAWKPKMEKNVGTLI